METLIKRKALFPSMIRRSVNNFFDDFITRDLSDWTDENLKKTDTNIEVELAKPGMKTEDFKVQIDDDLLINFSEKEEVRKRGNFIRKQFNYRSFCRLPNL